MQIYYLLFLIIIFLYLILGEQNKKIYYSIIMILLILIIGLRNPSVGTDTLNYLIMYREQTKTTIEYLLNTFPSLIILNSDPLYFIYCFILQIFQVNEQLFLFLTALISILCTISFFYKYSCHALISILSFSSIGLISVYISAMRQTLALSIVALAIPCIIEKKPLKFYFLVILASGFHITALIMLPAYLIVRLFRNWKLQNIFLLCSITGFIIKNAIYPVGLKLGLGIRFTQYFRDNVIGTSPLLIILYISIAIVYIFMNFGYKQSQYTTILNKELFIIYSIGVSILIMSLVNTIISRFAYYYLMSFPVILANSLAEVKKTFDRLVFYCGCIGIELLFFVITVPNSVFGISPYLFFWQ